MPDPKLSRRHLLGSLAAGATVPLVACDVVEDPTEPPPDPAPDRAPEPGPWAAEGTEDLALFPLGVQSGDPTPDAAILWTRYLGSADLRLVVVQADGDGWAPLVDEAVEPDEAGVVKLDRGDLSADTAYRYAFVDADGRRSPVGRVHTAPAADGFRKVVFGATSCTSQSHRPFPCLSFVAADHLDAFLLLGDTVYCDSAFDPAEYQNCWSTNFASQGYRDLRGACPTVMTWDDHEVTNVNSGEWDVTPERFAIASAEFWRFNSIRPGAVEGRIWRKLSFGQAVDLFVLDCRGERDEAAAQYVSPEQLQWLKDGLAASPAAFKIILNSVPMANLVAGVTDVDGLSPDAIFDVVATDRWEGYPAQRAEILDHIVDNAIPGVVWVSGDVHFGAAMTLEVDGPWATQWDIVSGPGGRGGDGNPLQIFFPDGPPFRFHTQEDNWVRFEVDPGTRTCEIAFIDNLGTTLYSQVLTA